jgi:hypothetical protein
MQLTKEIAMALAGSKVVIVNGSSGIGLGAQPRPSLIAESVTDPALFPDSRNQNCNP